MSDQQPGAAHVRALHDQSPELDPDAWVAPGATVVGAVHLASGASAWYGTVLRGDGDEVWIGPRSNIQDGSVVHADPGFPVRVGSGVSVGHRAVVHGAEVGDNVLVGMGAILMNGARVGKDCIVAAGAVVLEGTEIPPGSLVAGVPARVRRTLTDEEVDGIRGNAERYQTVHVPRHRAAREH